MMNKKERELVLNKLAQIATITEQLSKLECYSDDVELDAVFNNVLEDLEVTYNQLVPNSQS